MNFNSGGNQKSKAWRDIWGCGQGIGAVGKVVPVAELVDRLAREYDAAREALAAKSAPYKPSSGPSQSGKVVEQAAKV